MAAFDHVRDLYDITLKSRLIRSLLKEQLPDETRSFRTPSELSSIVFIIKTHELLSESEPNLDGEKHVSSWKSSVDSYVDRIMMLTRSNSPDKCWFGVCLLGVTITECSSKRFVDSYSDWFNALLPLIQPSEVSQLVKVASCAAVSDLLTRLGAFSNLKKDGNSHAGKLVQPILKMLNEEATETVLEVAAHLLSSIIIYFPPSIVRYYDNVEGAIIAKIMSGHCNPGSLKKLASCLALLPKSRGDGESWSLMMQKILVSLNSLLNHALEGLEEESRRDEAVALLVPPGTDPPPSLGDQVMAGESLNKGERSPELLMSTISSLMNCSCTMLTSFYPVQVEVPVRPVLAIVRRVLLLNGSVPDSLQPFTTAMQQEFVCSVLPALQLCSLEVLAAVVKGMHCQLLPHSADIVYILMGYFKKCWLPELRTKAYSVVRELLILMGAGLALYISQEVVSNVFIDLKFTGSESDGSCADEELHVEATMQRHPKKRKHGTAIGLPTEQRASFGSAVKASKEGLTSIALKLAALETLEALLDVGGALRSDSWRRRVDHLLIEVATIACRVGLTHDEKPFIQKEVKSTWEDFQLVALRALLASLLSPAGVRSPYLAQGLELFRKGKQNIGTKVAEFCASALLALEVLVHPRALPFMDMSLGRAEFGAQKYTDKSGMGGYDSHDLYDFLNDIYVENNSGSEAPPPEPNKRVHFNEPTDTSQDQNLEQPSTVNLSTDTLTPTKRGEGSTQANHDIQVQPSEDMVMRDVQDHQDSDRTSNVPDMITAREVSPPTRSSLADVRGVEECALDAKSTVLLSKASASGVESAIIPAGEDDSVLMMPVEEADGELFPDIVDADPDTDYGSE